MAAGSAEGSAASYPPNGPSCTMGLCSRQEAIGEAICKLAAGGRVATAPPPPRGSFLPCCLSVCLAFLLSVFLSFFHPPFLLSFPPQEDINEEPAPRMFWPREIWGRYATTLDEFKAPEHAEAAVRCLNHMVSRAWQDGVGRAAWEWGGWGCDASTTW